MTTQELRELDAWIAERVMGWTDIEPIKKHASSQVGVHPTLEQRDWIPKYTESPPHAMDVLKKCAEKISGMNIDIRKRVIKSTGWMVGTHGAEIYCDAETLELAICLFAKQLFSQTTK